MMLLYSVAWPPQGIYVEEGAKFGRRHEGREMARLHPATSRIAELVGAQPVTIQPAELSQAMATGVIDSYMSSGSTGYDTKTYEAHQVLVRHAGLAAQECGAGETAAFDALDKPTQDALLRPAQTPRPAAGRLPGRRTRAPRTC